MRNVLLIAKREYLQQIRGRAFRFSTVLLPLGILAMLSAIYVTGRHSSGEHLAIASDNAALANEIREQLFADKAAKLTVDVIAPISPEEQENLLQLVPQQGRRRTAYD